MNLPQPPSYWDIPSTKSWQFDETNSNFAPEKWWQVGGDVCLESFWDSSFFSQVRTVSFREKLPVTAEFLKLKFSKSHRCLQIDGHASKRLHSLKTNIAQHLKSYLSNRKVAFQPSFFRGYVKLPGCSHYSKASQKKSDVTAICKQIRKETLSLLDFLQ